MKKADNDKIYTYTYATVEYSISYELAGGEVEGQNPTKYTVESDSIKLINPTRTGYTFQGWIGTGLTEATIDVTIPKGSTGDREYTATWTANPVTVKVEYYLDGKKKTNGMGYGGQYPYEIKGKHYDDTLSIGVDIPGRENDLNLDAWEKWTNGYVLESVVVGSEQAYQLTEDNYQNPTRRYSTTLKDNITIKVYYVKDSGSMKDMIPDKYQVLVYYDVLNGYWDEGDKDNAEKHELVTLYENGNKWSTTASATLVNVPKVGNNPATGYTAGAWAETPGVPGVVDANYQYKHFKYAYTAVNYEIKYDLQGGSLTEGENPTTYTVETRDIKLINPTRIGYTFQGWTGTDLDKPTMNVTIPKGSIGNREYIATWAANPVSVNVEYYLDGVQQTGDMGYDGQYPYEIENKKYDDELTIGIGDKTLGKDLNLSAKSQWTDSYILESVVVDGTSIFTLTQDNYQNPKLDYSAILHDDVKIQVYYAKESGDNVPDKYQVTVTFDVVNGTWTDGTGNVQKSQTLTLLDADGKWSEAGSANASLPEAVANPGYKDYAWNPADTTVTKNSDHSFVCTYVVDESQRYTVTYVAEANGSVAPASENAQVLGTEGIKGATATPNDGYYVEGWYKDNTKIGDGNVLSAEKVIENLNTSNGVYADTTFTVKFTIRTDLSYTVRYLEDGTARELNGAKVVGGQTFGATVTESAINIPGYTMTSDKNPQSITIGTGENVITFYYKEIGPDVEPTPTETPTTPTIPTTPTTPTTPAGPTTPTLPATGGPSVTAAPEATQAPAEEEIQEEIQEEETPLAPEAGEGEEETIGEGETPLAGGNAAWALLNLILTILTALGSLILLIGYFIGRNRREEEDETTGETRTEYEVNRHGFWRLVSLIPGIGAIIVFILTEDMSLPMVFVDKWTLLMVIIAVIQIVIAVLSMRNREEPDEDDQANA